MKYLHYIFCFMFGITVSSVIDGIFDWQFWLIGFFWFLTLITSNFARNNKEKELENE